MILLKPLYSAGSCEQARTVNASPSIRKAQLVFQCISDLRRLESSHPLLRYPRRFYVKAKIWRSVVLTHIQVSYGLRGETASRFHRLIVRWSWLYKSFLCSL